MLSTMGTPSSGRLFLALSELFLSVFGWWVSGSFGSASHDSVPQSASPQLTMRTLAFLSPVNQVPSGSAARAGAMKSAPARPQKRRRPWLYEKSSFRPPASLRSGKGKRIAYDSVIASTASAAPNPRKCRGMCRSATRLLNAAFPSPHDRTLRVQF